MNDKTWQYVLEVQRKRAEKNSVDSKETRKPASPRASLTTSRSFGKKMQEVSWLVPMVKDGKSLEGLDMTRAKEWERTFGEFDKRYRPYVFRLLEKHCFFKRISDGEGSFTLRNGSIDAQEIYNDVIAVLLGGALWRFDFDGTRVGKGAFRRYLGCIVRSAFCKRVEPDLVPVFDADGEPVYTEEFEKDAKGRVKIDENGERIRKQKMIPRFVFEREQFELAHVKGLPKLFASRKGNSRLFSYIYRLALVAYICAIGEKRSKGRAPWHVDAMRAVFEGAESSADVIERLMRSRTITKREAFDTAKSYFLANWRKCWEKLCDPIIAKGPSKKKGTFIRHLKTTDDEALLYIAGQEEKVKVRYGKTLVEEVKQNFSNVMWMLVQKEDERESEKNAKYYR